MSAPFSPPPVMDLISALEKISGEASIEVDRWFDLSILCRIYQLGEAWPSKRSILDAGRSVFFDALTQMLKEGQVDEALRLCAVQVSSAFGSLHDHFPDFMTPEAFEELIDPMAYQVLRQTISSAGSSHQLVLFNRDSTQSMRLDLVRQLRYNIDPIDAMRLAFSDFAPAEREPGEILIATGGELTVNRRARLWRMSGERAHEQLFDCLPMSEQQPNRQTLHEASFLGLKKPQAIVYGLADGSFVFYHRQTPDRSGTALEEVELFWDGNDLRREVLERRLGGEAEEKLDQFLLNQKRCEVHPLSLAQTLRGRRESDDLRERMKEKFFRK